MTVLHFGAIHGHVPVVKRLISAGADVNAADHVSLCRSEVKFFMLCCNLLMQ